MNNIKVSQMKNTDIIDHGTIEPGTTMDTGNIDSEKRQTLRILAGLTSTALIASTPLSADINTASPALKIHGDLLNCRLISRADISRAHLLMHNKTDTYITASRFAPQLIQFDDTLMNLEDAYYNETVVIPPNDRVMVRLNVEAGLNKKTPYKNVINLNNKTQYLPQGTRVVELAVRVMDGVCTISNASVQA